MELDSSYEDIGEPPPKRPLLESVGNCFRQNRLEREKRIAAEESKRQAEKVHAKFIRDHIASPQELAKADYVVGTWAKINRVRAEPKRKRDVTQHARSSQPLQTSSSLNNQTTKPASPSGTSTDSSSKLPAVVRKSSASNSLDTSKSKAPSPSDILNLSSLTIGNLISVDQNYSGDNQSKSKSDRDNQSASENENSASEDMDRSLILVSDDIVSPSSPRSCYTCRVIHCEAVFTSQAKLNHHMNQFQHSPCNPCLKAKDGKLFPDPVCYMCPKCDEDFKTTAECSAHMRSQNHLSFLAPLKIAGYICPQCLAMFENFDSCWDHIAKVSHRFVSYPFLDDLKGHQPAEVGPVAVSEELAMDFIDKCKKVPFRVQCMECSLEIETSAMLRQHMAETNRQHPLSSLATCNPVDIFADYLAEFQCCNCYRLFTTYVPTHFCAKDIQGTLIESNVKSFHDFVKSCALTLTQTEHESQSCTDCADNTQGQPPCMQNLIQVLEHSPGKGAIPKTNKQQNLIQVPVVESSQEQNTIPKTRRQQNSSQVPVIVSSPEKRTIPKTKRQQNSVRTVEHTPEDDGIPVINKQLNLLQNIEHGPEKGAIPKIRKQTNIVSDRPQNKSAQSKEIANDIIVLDTPPDPRRTGPGRIKEIPIKEQIVNVDENFRKRKRSRLEPESLETISIQREESSRHRSRSPTKPHPTATENLTKMKNIIFLDLDNWPGFFSKLPRRLPDLTFVWGFYGGKCVWREPYKCYAFSVMKRENLFHLHERCGQTKDAADFAIVLTVGQMHERLPKHIPFTIVSGDKGFIEVERQMRDSHRKAVVIDPHSAQKFSDDMIYTMVTSVADT